MIYLNKEDLIALSFERFIDESANDQDTVIETIELQNIELIKSFLGNRYDVSKIFDAEQPIRNAVLVMILSKLMLFTIIRRNAARKVPTDLIEEYNKAMELLERISTGKVVLDDLPKPQDENGNIKSNSIWGNNSNPNFYI